MNGFPSVSRSPSVDENPSLNEKHPKRRRIPKDAITEQDLNAVLLLDKGTNVSLKSWKVVDFTQPGDNYASKVTSVELTFPKNNADHRCTYVVKLNPCRGPEDSDSIMNLIFQKEAKFYLTLIPKLNSILESNGENPLRFPRCFHANLKIGKEQIYFEDLRTKGYKMFDRKKGFDVAHTTLILKEMARLHASSYLLQLQDPDEPLEIQHEFLTKDWGYIMKSVKEDILPLLGNYITTASTMLRKVGGYERAVSWVESLKPQLKDILTRRMRSNRFDVVCHGDCWNNNLLFKYDGECCPIDVVLLDVQSCSKASLASDLNYLMYTSLDSAVRRPNLGSFLSCYYDSFKNTISAGGSAMYFTEEDLLKEFRDKNILGAYFSMMLLPVVLMESDEAPDLDEEDIDYHKIMNQVTDKAMTMLDTNPLMEPRFLSIFDEFMETGLIPS